VQVWFNPKCSKCRMAAAAFDEAGLDYEVRRYLDEPPTRDDLRQVLELLGLEPWDITRMGEERATELDLANRPREREAWLDLLAGNPVLIQRPIVVTDDGSAWIARDEETVAEVVQRAQEGGAR
jgi:arsenate reductase (glutaredoxin)